MKKLKKSVMAALLAALILAAVLPAAVAAQSVQAVVASASMNVYRLKAPHKYIGTLPQGTSVTVKAYSGQAALISYNGHTGIVRVSDLSTAQDAGQTVSKPEATKPPMATASAEELANARTMVTNRKTRVYRRASRTSDYVSVKAGIRLSVLSVSGSVAKVASGSLVGYMVSSHLSDPADPTPTPAPTQGGLVEKYDRVPVKTTAAAKIYAKPSTSSSSVTVKQGTNLVLLAVKGNCAMIEKDGKVGYIAKSLLTTDVTVSNPTPTPKPAATPRVSDSDVYSGSNEEIIFKFLTQVAGFNTAAACGIMGNIKYESGYKPTSTSAGGVSYGICQWTGARKTRLTNWCKENGYDKATLKGQLYFLQHELKRYYPAVYNRLIAVPNTDQGAYDAGYDFCYNFEAPSSRASRSVTRGNYARTTLWKRYKT
ncbi:MAG: hypothetical protein IJJ45_02175 [Clostridia bacterium]|nr:hypothetical protein [Clostridia bacterium]